MTNSSSVFVETRKAEKEEREVERTKRDEERQRKREEREWKAHEKTLRKAGAIDATISTERARWDADKAKQKLAEEEERQRAAEAENARRDEERERAEKAARDAVDFLREHLGADFAVGFRR